MNSTSTASTRKRHISQTIYLFAKGEKLGPFVGEENDGTIECLYFEHMINAPRDPSTGLSSSNLRHIPVVLRKQVDATSPLFANALSTNETFETVHFTFVPSTYTSGSPPATYFIRLSNATIASFKQYFSDQPSARYVGWQMLEEIAFHYQKIEWGFDENVGATATWPLGS